MSPGYIFETKNMADAHLLSLQKNSKSIFHGKIQLV